MQRFNLALAALLLATTATAGAAPAKPAAKATAKAKPAAKPASRPVASAPRIVALPDTPEIAELRRGYRFAFPVYEMMRTRGVQLGRAKALGLPNAVNFLLPKLTLADATSRDVTTPNNDTLYGSVWLDLSGGPVLVTVPALGGRYHSAALMSAQTDNTAILGTRTGGQGGRYAIVGPGYTGPTPAGTELVRSASTDAWLLIRVLVNGPEDIESAANALDGFKVVAAEGNATPTETPTETLPAPAVPNGKTFLAVVNEALARSAANATLSGKAAGFAGLGIGGEATAETVAMWTKYLPALRAELKDGLASAGDVVDGWSYPKPGIGEAGADDDLRSYVAVGGLAALPRVEAMYLTARTDKDGAALTGARAYRVNLPPRLPVGAFWSLTMYQQEANGGLYFVANSLNRFAVGDRSKHLRSNRDGSYEIFVQAARPEGERVVNWLPAPKGKFVLVWRAYLPRAPLLDGSFHLPPVEIGEVVP